jgi:hypothetical protein
MMYFAASWVNVANNAIGAVLAFGDFLDCVPRLGAYNSSGVYAPA